MKNLSLFVFIDALGWEVLKGRSFLNQRLPYRRKLKSVLGYSSACVPSILSGLRPQDHGHWSFYYANPDQSPFKYLSWLHYLPLQGRGRIRHLMSRCLQKILGWDGYFQLYNMPLNKLALFDYCEKKDIFKADGIRGGKNIFERLAAQGVRFHCSDWRQTEQNNIAALTKSIEMEQPEFAFLYLADLDGLLHRVGKASERVDEKLAWYESQLIEILDSSRASGREVDLFICSDHGMATVGKSINLMAEIEALPLTYGVDYIAAYDSTMARFWFYSSQAKPLITATLALCDEGRVLDRAELIELGCNFPGDRYGEMIFLLKPGVVICPSHMGTEPTFGMHGYHPDHADSDAVLLSSKPLTGNPQSICDLNKLMRSELKLS